MLLGEKFKILFTKIKILFINLTNPKLKKMEKNISKVRAHDAIVGVLYLSGVGLSYLTGNFSFLWIVIGVGFLQIISPFTKFCPVYFVLNKMMPDSDPIQDGK